MSVYVMTDGVALKIGYTRGRPEDRLVTLQTGSSRQLALVATMPAGREVERALHAELETERLRGEWFARTDRVVEAIAAARRRALMSSLTTLCHYVIHSFEIARLHLLRGDRDAENAFIAEIARATKRINAVVDLFSATTTESKEGRQ